MNLSKHPFAELAVSNHDVLELLKQAIQPVEQYYEFGVCRVFAGKDSKFSNIWIPDLLKPKEERKINIANTNKIEACPTL